MLETIPHAIDFELAQKCLENDPKAIEELQETYSTPLVNYLKHRGATIEEAREVVSDLWGDCVMPRPERKPRLATYSGNAPLQAWLKVVALNSLLQRKRTPTPPSRPIDEEPIPAPPGPESRMEAPLVQLMKEAVQRAFQECEPEGFVLVQLAHTNGLRGWELARMFACSEAKISRTLESTRRTIEATTIRYIKAHDPWLEIRWEDFLELCRVAGPECFGVE
jgi:DNA-directed RNA polymerase specialized sigma24 family protein